MNTDIRELDMSNCQLLQSFCSYSCLDWSQLKSFTDIGRICPSVLVFIEDGRMPVDWMTLPRKVVEAKVSQIDLVISIVSWSFKCCTLRVIRDLVKSDTNNPNHSPTGKDRSLPIAAGDDNLYKSIAGDLLSTTSWLGTMGIWSVCRPRGSSFCRGRCWTRRWRGGLGHGGCTYVSVASCFGVSGSNLSTYWTDQCCLSGLPLRYNAFALHMHYIYFIYF